MPTSLFRYRPGSALILEIVSCFGQAVKKTTPIRISELKPSLFVKYIRVSFSIELTIGRAPHSNRIQVNQRESGDVEMQPPGKPFSGNRLISYLPNQPMGLPERSTQTLFTCVYISRACFPISRP